MSRKNLNGLPEDILIVCPTAEPGLPVDEINCALGRADAVISMVMMALNNSEARIADFVLVDALWSAQSQLAPIRKMNEHAHATTTPINSSTANPASGV